MARKNISIRASVEDKASKPMLKISAAARKAAEDQAEAEGKLVKLHRKSADEMQKLLSPAQKVTAAIKAQTAAGNPLATKLASLQKQHQGLTIALRAEAKSGKALNASMVKQAAAAQMSIAQTKAKIAAEKKAAKAARDMALAQGVAAKAALEASRRATELAFRTGQAALRSRNLTLAKNKEALAQHAAAAATNRSAEASRRSAAILGKAKVAALAATAAFVAMTVRAIRAADNIGKTSRKLGVAAQDLQLYRKIADDAGISSSQLDNALRSLTRRAADAAAGNREFAKGFEKLGVSVTTADGRLKTISELLPEMADGFRNMTDGGVRVSAAMATMSDAGAEMLPMLVGGSDAMIDATANAYALGGVLDDTLIAKAEETAQAFGDLGFAFDGLMASDAVAGITRAFAIGTTHIIKNIQGTIQELDGVIHNINNTSKKTTEGEIKRLQVIASIHEAAAEKYADNEGLKDRALRRSSAARAKISKMEAAKTASILAKKAADERVAAREAVKIAGEKDRAIAASARNRLRDERAAEAQFARDIQDIYDRIEEEQLASDKFIADARSAWRKKRDEEIKAGNKEVADAKKKLDEEEDARRRAMASAAAAEFESNMATGMLVANTLQNASLEMFASMADGSKTAGEAFEAMTQSILAAAAQETMRILTLKAVEAAVSAYGANVGVPVVGPILAAAAATAAFGAVTAWGANMAEGGVVTGGIEGKDSVRITAMPGEEIIKTRTARDFKRETGQTISAALEGGGIGGGVTNVFPQPAAPSFVFNSVVPAGSRQRRDIARMVNRELMSARARGAAI